MKELTAFISIDPDIRFGKPCITGTRITVSDILQWLTSGMNFQEILADYPLLKEEHLKAALSLYEADDFGLLAIY